MTDWEMRWDDGPPRAVRLLGESDPVPVPDGLVRVALTAVTGPYAPGPAEVWVCWDDTTSTVRTTDGALLWHRTATRSASRVDGGPIVHDDGLLPRRDRSGDAIAVRCVQDLVEVVGAEEVLDVHRSTARLRGEEDDVRGEVSIDLDTGVVLDARGTIRHLPWSVTTLAQAALADRPDLLDMADTPPPTVG